MTIQQESAVSPVVGVMLMLVVTIIIAAVVSAFAGGLNSDQSMTPQASLFSRVCHRYVQDTEPLNNGPNYPEDAVFTARNGIAFELNEGTLSILTTSTSSAEGRHKILTRYIRSHSTSTCLPTSVTSYIMEIGDSDGYISPGDKFMLYTDNCFNDELYHLGYGFSVKPDGATGGMSMFKNEKIQYKVVDKKSKMVIGTGEITIK
jgi:hypothetical protein